MPSRRGYGRSAEQRREQMLIALKQRKAGMHGTMLPAVRMSISEWFTDENGCPTRIIRQLDDPWDHGRG